MNGAYFVLLLFVRSASMASINYWELRANLLQQETFRYLGGKLNLNHKERIANEILMLAKEDEIQEGFTYPDKFLPSKNFLKVSKAIENSQVFQIIRRMPKGAVLHSHDTAMASGDFLLNNITYRDHLYVCDDNGALNFRFLARPPDNSNCEWRLLANLRKNLTMSAVLNERIHRQLSMITDDPSTAYPNGNVAWLHFRSIFAYLKPLLTYRPVFEDYFYQVLQELYDDNVIYLEIRSTLPNLYDLDGREYDVSETVRVYQKTSERFCKDHPQFIGTKLIYAPFRGVSRVDFQEYVTTARKLKDQFPSYVIGFDLVGQEDQGKPLIEFIEELRTFPKNYSFFFHAGETNWNGLTDDNLIDAVLLGVKRIGHGFAVTKHPRVLEMVRDRDIGIEVCPISNQVLTLVDDIRNHPASVLFSDDYPVVISNDDPGLWGSKGLSYDFYEAFMGIMSRRADIRSLKKLALNSLRYSGLSDVERKHAIRVWKSKWKNFVNDLMVYKSVEV